MRIKLDISAPRHKEFFDKLKAHDKNLVIMAKTGALSISTPAKKKSIEELISAYEWFYSRRVKKQCPNGSCAGRALRLLADNYKEMKAQDLRANPKPKKEPKAKEVEDKFKFYPTYSDMKMPALRKACKAAGIKPKNTDKKVDLIKMLENNQS